VGLFYIAHQTLLWTSKHFGNKRDKMGFGGIESPKEEKGKNLEEKGETMNTLLVFQILSTIYGMCETVLSHLYT
jgi:hypothetical protein